MFNKHVELFKRAFIEQKFNAFARNQLAALVLCLCAFGPATRTGFRTALLQFFQNLLHELAPVKAQVRQRQSSRQMRFGLKG